MPRITSITTRSLSSPPCRPGSATPRALSSRTQRSRSRQPGPLQCRNNNRSKSEHFIDTERNMTPEPPRRPQYHLTRDLVEILPGCLGDIASHCPSDAVEDLTGRLYQSIGDRWRGSLERHARLDTATLSTTLEHNRKSRGRELREVREHVVGLKKMLGHKRESKVAKEQLSFNGMMERFKRKRKEVVLDQIRKMKDSGEFQDKIRIIGKSRSRYVEREEGYGNLDGMMEENEDDCYGPYYRKTKGPGNVEIEDRQMGISSSGSRLMMIGSQEKPNEQDHLEPAQPDLSYAHSSNRESIDEVYSKHISLQPLDILKLDKQGDSKTVQFGIQSADNGSVEGFGPGQDTSSGFIPSRGSSGKSSPVSSSVRIEQKKSSNVNKRRNKINKKPISDSGENSRVITPGSTTPGSTTPGSGLASRDDMTKEPNTVETVETRVSPSTAGGTPLLDISTVGCPNTDESQITFNFGLFNDIFKYFGIDEATLNNLTAIASGNIISNSEKTDIEDYIPFMNNHEMILRSLDILLKKVGSTHSLEDEEMRDKILELNRRKTLMVKNSIAGVKQTHWLGDVRKVLDEMMMLEERQMGKLKDLMSMNKEDADNVSKLETVITDLKVSYMKHVERRTPQDGAFKGASRGEDRTLHGDKSPGKILSSKSSDISNKRKYWRKYMTTLKAAQFMKSKGAFKGAFGVFADESERSILSDCTVPMLGHFSKNDNFVFMCEVVYIPELYTMCSEPEDDKSYDYWGVEPMSLEDYQIEDPLQMSTLCTPIQLHWPNDTAQIRQGLKEGNLSYSTKR